MARNSAISLYGTGTLSVLLELLLQLLVMEDVLSSDPTRESRSDFPFSRQGRTIFVLLLYLGHMGNSTVMVF